MSVGLALPDSSMETVNAATLSEVGNQIDSNGVFFGKEIVIWKQYITP